MRKIIFHCCFKHAKPILFTFIFVIGIIIPSGAQVNVWSDIAASSLTARKSSEGSPLKFRAVKPNHAALKIFLASLPLEGKVSVRNSQKVMSLPMPDGSIENFRVVESPIMEKALAEKSPEIKTYMGQGIEDPSATVRFDLTLWGFHAIIIKTDGYIFIEPNTRGNQDQYIVYNKKDLPAPLNQKFCEVKTELSKKSISPGVAAKVSGAQLRTYRLAMAATGEYTVLNGGTVPLALSALITVVNQVDAIYEKEVAIRFVLVANNNKIIFTNATMDPYTDVLTNPCSSPIRSENQKAIDDSIGSANYDIGHVFTGTNIGGCAAFSVVCGGTKAWGASGVINSTPGEIGLTAHEMGHQFSAQHTFNSNTGTCLGVQYAAGAAYEPGSGTTIMSYAGACQNIQSFRNLFFHTKSYEEIIDFSTTGGGNACSVNTSTGNTAPTVNAGASGFIIPINTPFILAGSGSDPDGDAVTFSWEEFDLGPTGNANSPSGTAPIFRSFPPVSNTSRTFPKLADILNNTQVLGEILPSYSRALNFRLTARDNRTGGGGVEYASMSMSVDGASGPFIVTIPNTAVSWCPGVHTVTWDVANTNAAPVNVANVNIKLSTDGGLTFPITLLANTPNDGSHSVTIPCVKSTRARIKVEAVGNVFFDISNTNFTTGDNTNPTFTTPASIIINKDANCNYDASTAITGDVTDEDDNCDNTLNATFVDETVAGTCVGETIIRRTWTLTDDCGNSTIKVQTITITDVTAPTFTKPADITIYKNINCNYNASAGVTGDVTDEADNCDNTLDATFTDGVVPGICMGEEIITRTWSLSDDCGNNTTHDQVITARDTTRPAFANVAADPSSLWPPNHKMKDVTINYDVTDNCSDVDHITNVLTVTSNEPIDSTGDGDTSPDWEVIDQHHVRLRAERAGNGDGRIYTITITSTDDCGNVATTTATVVVVHNITGPNSGKSFKIGSTVAFSGRFWDKPGNTHTSKWIFDETIQANGIVTEPSGKNNGTINGSYKFNTAGVYKVKMNITDQRGITSYATTNGDLEEIVVIYDPNGGYTYGGGWFPSGAGALIGSPAVTGKASYGFTANRFKNAANPRGETQFKFQVGDFEFNAINFEYLAIVEAKAQFKGSGKITGGQSGISFIMTVLDGDLPSGGGIDKIRMKIFNKNTGYVYYDNQPGASDADNPTTSVGTNSIIVVSGSNVINNAAKEYNAVQTGNEVIKGMIVKAMPNPSNSNFTISVSSDNNEEKITIYVFDMYGRKIEERLMNNNSVIRIGDNYRPGVYAVRITQGSKNREMKLVKFTK